MRHARTLRGGLGAALFLGVINSTGCTHNHYYGANPCAPVTTTVVPGVATSGGVCEVLPDGTTTVVSTTPARTTPSFLGVRPPRVVMSDSTPSRYPWRTPNPDTSLATTKVEGALDSSTVTK